MTVLATNYCTNPSFELDANADGLADGWYSSGSTHTAPTFSRVAALGEVGAYAQRMQYTGVAADGGSASASINYALTLSDFTAGDVITASMLLKGSVSGCSLRLVVVGGSWGGSTCVLPIGPTSGALRYSRSATIIAGATTILVVVQVLYIDDGSTFDITVDDVLIEKSPVADNYFDGSSAGCAWTAPANAARSTDNTGRTNYCAYPSFELDSNLDGFADGYVHNSGDGVTYSLAAALPGSTGTYAQRMWYTGGVGDANASKSVVYHGPAGVWSAGDPIAVSFLLSGSVSGCTCAAAVGNQLGQAIGPSVHITPGAVQTVTITGTMPAATTYPVLTMALQGIDNGDTFDITIDDLIVEKAVVAGSYFDGSHAGCIWAPVPNATTSERRVPLIVCEGDSHTAGLIDSYPTFMSYRKDGVWDVIDVATGGEYLIDQIDGEAAAQVDALYDANRPCVCVIWAGANDMSSGGKSGQQVYDALHAYCEARAAVGWLVVVNTFMGNADPTFDAKRNAANALLVADHHFADGLADIAADPRIGADDSKLDLTYFDGSVHLNPVGKNIVTGIVQTAIELILGEDVDMAETREILAGIQAAMDTIGALEVIVTSPVAASGTITLYSGDDYATADSRQITVTVADATHALGLDTAAVCLKCTQATFTGTAVSTTPGYTVTFQLTHAQTAALTFKRQKYEIEATLADTNVVTLATGQLVVVKDIPPVAAP